MLMRGGHHDINVLEDCLGCDSRRSVGGFHQVVPWLSAMLASKNVNKGERLTELFGSN